MTRDTEGTGVEATGMTHADMIAALESAHAEVADMCQRQWEGKPAINWSVQARHGDSDIAISQAIRAVLAALRATPEGTPLSVTTLDALQADIVRRWDARIRPELNYPTAGDILEFMGHVNEAFADARRAEAAPPLVKAHAQQVGHRCAGCGHRWEGRLVGPEVCGDCWRKVRPVLHGEAAPPAPDLKRMTNKELLAHVNSLVAAPAPTGTDEDIFYSPERHGRRCVDHPTGDHELVCLTCMAEPEPNDVAPAPTPQHRPDGWPLCPSCGADELADLNTADWPMIFKADPTAELKCYVCQWVGTIRWHLCESVAIPAPTLDEHTCGSMSFSAVHGDVCVACGDVPPPLVVVRDLHVMPIGDLTKHEATRQCWCRPKTVRDAPNVVVHNSADGRELVERGGVQ